MAAPASVLHSPTVALKGRIKSTQATFAFLTDEHGVDRFFHRRDLRVSERPVPAFEDLRDLLFPGMLVQCEPVAHERGPRAIRVHVLPE